MLWLVLVVRAKAAAALTEIAKGSTCSSRGCSVLEYVNQHEYNDRTVWNKRAVPALRHGRAHLARAPHSASMPASIPIKHRGTLASRAVIRPRAIFSRTTIAPGSSRPIKCRVFLPVSMPMV